MRARFDQVRLIRGERQRTGWTSILHGKPDFELKPDRSEHVQAVKRPLLFGVTGVDAPAHSSQRVVEDLHLFAPLFVGWMGLLTVDS